MRKFNKNQAINHRKYIIYWWYKSNEDFIQNYPYLAKLWPKNGTHAHTWTYIFWPTGLKIFMELRRWLMIIYRLMVRNSSYDLRFWPTFGGKMGVATTCAHYVLWHGLGPPNLTKKLPTRSRWTFWVNHYLEIMFSKFLGVNPPLKGFIF